MSSIDAHKGSGEEQKAAIPPGVEVSPDQDTRKNRLRELQVRLGRLLRRYSLGEYKVDALHEVVSELEEERAKPPITEDFEGSRPSLLYATARVLQGQIYDRRRDDRSREEFSKAVAVFDEVLSKEGELSSQYYAEYGLALRMVGERQQDARKYLERANSLGLSTPETHRHLGLILKDRGDHHNTEREFEKASRYYDKAVREFEKALKLAPDDPLTHEALGETLEARGQPEEAAAAYQDAAFAMELAGDHKQSLTMLERALSLTLDNTTTEALLRKLGRHEEAQRALNRTPAVEALVVKGEMLRAQGDYDEALQTLDEALALEPDHARALVARGETLRMMGKYDEALQALGEALKQPDLEPDHARALVARGETLRMMGKYREALQTLGEALKEKPDYTWALVVRGETLRKLRRYDEALQVLKQALTLEPNHARALVAKGKTLRAQGDYDEALQALDEALALEPDYAWALVARGETLRKLGRYGEALQALDRALALEPGYTRALGAKGETLRVMGEYEEALQALDQALDQDKNYTWALGTKGETLRIQGKYDEARQVLDDALEQKPDYAFALGTKGAVLYALGSYVEALRMLNQALKEDRDYTFALIIKGQILCAAAYYRLAIEALERAERVNSSRPNSSNVFVFALKGWALENLDGNHRKTLRASEDALKLGPDNAYLRKAYANALYLLDDDEAKTEYRLAIEQASELTDEGGANAPALMGWCYFRLGEYDEAVQRYEEALEVLDRALTLDPNDTRDSDMVSSQRDLMVAVRFDLALALLMCGKQHERALREYTQALESIQGIYALRRRGLLHVAWQDLKVAVTKQRQRENVKEVREAQGLLKDALDEVKRLTPTSARLKKMTKAV